MTELYYRPTKFTWSWGDHELDENQLKSMRRQKMTSQLVGYSIVWEMIMINLVEMRMNERWLTCVVMVIWMAAINQHILGLYGRERKKYNYVKNCGIIFSLY